MRNQCGHFRWMAEFPCVDVHLEKLHFHLLAAQMVDWVKHYHYLLPGHSLLSDLVQCLQLRSFSFLRMVLYKTGIRSSDFDMVHRLSDRNDIAKFFGQFCSLQSKHDTVGCCLAFPFHQPKMNSYQFKQ